MSHKIGPSMMLKNILITITSDTMKITTLVIPLKQKENLYPNRFPFYFHDSTLKKKTFQPIFMHAHIHYSSTLLR